MRYPTLVPELRIVFLVNLCLLSFYTLISQDKNPWTEKPEFEVFGFVDIYYVYDFNEPNGGNRQPFFYNHNRHQEVNLNLGFIGLMVQQTKYRANITLQAGTYAQDNYASEQTMLKNVFEAYAGISLNKRNNLWLDVGIFQSHLGFESAISIDNWTLTRSLVAENSPFFLAGAKVTYTPSDKVQVLGVICNGWQRIQRVAWNTMPSFGTQLVITPNEKYTINWSTFVGTDHPDSVRKVMIFNNFYAKMQFMEKFGLLAGFDFGFRQISKGSGEFHDWYGITIIAHYKFARKWAAALRGELYGDKNGVIVVIEDSPNGFRTSGLSLNFDFVPIPQIACRLETRWLHSPDEIYPYGDTRVQDNVFITGSIAVKLGKRFN
jgi:hypothetical protein